MVDHFEALAPRFDDARSPRALTDGAELAKELLGEARDAIAEHDLHGGPAAQSVGKSGAGLRGGVGDNFLERNQALRMAVLDVQHTVTLLGYLESVSGEAGTTTWPSCAAAGTARCSTVEQRMRAAVIVLGTARRRDRAASTPAWSAAPPTA